MNPQKGQDVMIVISDLNSQNDDVLLDDRSLPLFHV
jgi:hypothetical protein